MRQCHQTKHGDVGDNQSVACHFLLPLFKQYNVLLWTLYSLEKACILENEKCHVMRGWGFVQVSSNATWGGEGGIGQKKIFLIFIEWLLKSTTQTEYTPIYISTLPFSLIEMQEYSSKHFFHKIFILLQLKKMHLFKKKFFNKAHDFLIFSEQYLPPPPPANPAPPGPPRPPPAPPAPPAPPPSKKTNYIILSM